MMKQSLKKVNIPLAALLLLVFASIMALTIPAPKASAAQAKDFNPGRIIDNAVFYNSDAMTVQQIQNFLNAKVPHCDTNGSGKATDWNRPDITRATLASYIRNGTHGYTKNTAFHAPPYTCLKDYKKNTPQMPAASGLCSGIAEKTNQTAAQMIYSVARACGINPQVLIVLLTKEQSLVTDIWPLKTQYDKATGFDCPDTAPCDPAYAGLFYQLYYAARQYKVYQAFPNNYNYIAGRTNTIYWHPDLSRCGSSRVYIENQATAALYIYTPYRPNQAALNNLYGEGNSCSSYGNRNFWRIFTDWFGSTQVSYTSLASPRIMQITKPTQKVNLHTNEPYGPVLASGAQTFFPDMIRIEGQWYARTEYDRNNNNFVGIPVSDIGDIPIQNITPTWVSVNTNTEKIDPLRRTSAGPAYGEAAAKILSKITVGGVEYLRTEFDHTAGRTHFIRASDTVGFRLYDFIRPRILVTSKSTDKINPLTNTVVSVTPANTLLTLNKKVIINGTQYVQAVDDNGTNHMYKFDDFNEVTPNDIGAQFVPLDTPRWMQLGANTSKVEALSPSQQYGPALSTGSQAYFIDKVLIDGIWYARTQYDNSRGNPHVIPASDLINIPVTPISPVWMSITSKTQKIDPTRDVTFEDIDDLTAAEFVDKITVAGKDYYRTAYEQSKNRYRFISQDALESFKFFEFIRPRQMTTKANVSKINVQTGEVVASVPTNTTTTFNKKITIGGVLYAQMESDNGTPFAVAAGSLK